MVEVTSRADRPRGGSPTVPVSVTLEQRAQVEAELRRGTVEKRVYLRAQALLMMAEGFRRDGLRGRSTFTSARPKSGRNAYFAERGLVSRLDRYRTLLKRFGAPAQLTLALG
jgi:hypothetical protein